MFARLNPQGLLQGMVAERLQIVVDGEIAPSVPLEAMTSNQMIDANLGIRPDPRPAAMLIQPNAEQTASAGIPPTAINAEWTR